ERGYVGLDLEKIMLTSGSYRERAMLHMRSQPRDPRTLQFVAGGRPLLSIAQEMIDKVGERINWKRTQLPSGEKMGAFHIVNAIMVAKRVVERYDAVRRRYQQLRQTDPEEAAAYRRQVGEQLKGAGLPMTRDDAQALLRYAEAEFPEVLELAKEYSRQLSQVALNLAEEAGLLTPEARDRVEKGSDPESYMPFYYSERERPVIRASLGRRTARQPVQRFRGQARPVTDFISASVLKLAEIEQAAAYKRTLDTLEELIRTGKMGPFGEIVRRPSRSVQVSAQQVYMAMQSLLEEMTDPDRLGNASIRLFVPG